MRRTLVYPSEQPTDAVWLNHERNALIALGYLAQGTLGLNTVADGLAVTPTIPASLAVSVAAGTIYQLEPVDQNAYGSLPADTVHQIIKQGINLDAISLTITPPSTVGQSQNYLIEAQLLESDGTTTVLPYFNSANPLVPFFGPNGTGTAQPTIRDCTVQLQAKPGTAATSGTQTTPAPDAGYVGLFVVTVAQGQTTITAPNITQYSAAPFMLVKLPGVPNYIQAGSWHWVTDTGTANQLVFTMSPTPAALTAGMEVFIKKTGATCTGAMTVVANGGSSVSLLNADGSAISSGEAIINFMMHLLYDGTSWRFMNGISSTAVGSLAASAGEGIGVSGGGVVSLNFPSLTSQPAIASGDLIGYYSQGDTHHRSISWANLLSAMPQIPAMASPAEHLAGTLLTKTTNPAGVLSMIKNYPNAVAANGYVTLPSGLIMQWGSVSPISGNEGQVTVTYPIAFPNACFSITTGMKVIPGGFLADATIQVNSITLTNFVILQQVVGIPTTVSGVLGYFWIAFGN